MENLVLEEVAKQIKRLVKTLFRGACTCDSIQLADASSRDKYRCAHSRDSVHVSGRQRGWQRGRLKGVTHDRMHVRMKDWPPNSTCLVARAAGGHGAADGGHEREKDSRIDIENIDIYRYKY